MPPLQALHRLLQAGVSSVGITTRKLNALSAHLPLRPTMPRNRTFICQTLYGIAALLALAILGSSITAVQVAAIVVVCGCVLVEIFYDQLATLFGGRGAD